MGLLSIFMTLLLLILTSNNNVATAESESIIIDCKDDDGYTFRQSDKTCLTISLMRGDILSTPAFCKKLDRTKDPTRPVSFYCPKTCGEICTTTLPPMATPTPRPMSTPTATPTATVTEDENEEREEIACEDDEEYTFQNSTKTCAKIALLSGDPLRTFCNKKDNKIEGRKIVSSYCPKTCGIKVCRTPSSPKEEEKVKKPNILLILADDVGQGDLPYYWNSSLVDMPNIDNLHEKGVTFIDAHSTPNCAPSRYMILSGNYIWRSVIPNGKWELNNANENSFTPYQKSIAQTLRDDGGYKTGMYGKWHMGGGVQRPEGSKINRKKILTDPAHDWSGQLIQGPHTIGFDRSLITISGIQNQPYAYFRDGFLDIDPAVAKLWKTGSYEMPHGTSEIPPRMSGEGAKDWDSSAYNMIIVNETMDFINNHLKDDSDDPFFAYLALSAVHHPHTPPNAYIDGSKIKDLYQTRHMDMLHEMDKAVGSLVTLIEEKGIANDTIIIFASDNGGLDSDRNLWQTGSNFFGHRSSGGLRGSKGSIYEGGHTVPLIVRYDNHFPQGEERKQLVGLTDIYATICDLVGIPVPYLSAEDSISFADYFNSDGSSIDSHRKELAMLHFATKQGWTMQAFRDENFKLVHHRPLNTFELYDLNSDRAEKINLYVDENGEYSELLAELYAKLIQAGPCPLNKKGTFTLSGPGEDSGSTVDCKWFEQSTSSRCGKYIEGRLHCHSICATTRFQMFCESEKLPPKPSFPSCSNSKKTFIYNYGSGNNVKTKMANCDFATKRKLCYNRSDIIVKCPVTCKQSCNCFDTIGEFMYKGKIKKCKWVQNKKDQRCKNVELLSRCPETCGTC